MFARQLNDILVRLNIHYGWIMAGMAFITTVFSSAVSSVPQIIILPITNEFSWQIFDVSNAVGVMYVILGCCAPFAGALMLKIGIGRVAILAMMFSVFGLVLTSLADQKWHLLISIGVFFGVASGIIGLGLAATVATRWFVRRRGLVVGVLASAFAAGQLLFVPLMAWITTIADWRYALFIPIFGGILSASLFLLFSKNWPSELGIPPFGGDAIYNPPEEQSDNFISTTFQVLFGSIKHPAFWMLASTFLICGLSSTGIVGQHFIPFCADNNVGIVAASSYLAIMGIFNFMGTIGSGWLSDRFDNYKLLMAYYGLRALSLYYLPFSGFEFYTLIIWAVFFGLDYIATVPPTVKLSGQAFGPVNGPIIFGWIFGAHQIGSAIAASSAGWARDAFLSYIPSFIGAGIFSTLAVLIIFFFKNNISDPIKNKSLA